MTTKGLDFLSAAAGAVSLLRPLFGRGAPEDALLEVQRRLIEESTVFCLLRPDGSIIAITPNAATVLGAATERAPELKLGLAEILMPEDRAAFDARVAPLFGSSCEAVVVRVPCRGVSAPHRWFEVRGRNMLDTPELQAIVVEIEDVTTRADADARTGLMAAAYRNTPDSVIITDARGCITWVNAAFERVSGHSAADVIGLSPSILKSGRHRPDYFTSMWQTITAGRPFTAELVNRRRDGGIYHEDIVITPVRDDLGAITHFVSVARDITKRKALELHLEDRAYFDVLTGVANQRLLRERSGQILALARRHGKTAALLHIDIHRLRSLNQSHGRETGDVVLRSIADRLKQGLRESDTLARLPGDEFLVLLSEVSEEESAARVVRRLRDAVCMPYNIRHESLSVEAHIGVALFPQDARTYDELTECAELAMVRARANAAGFEFYQREVSELTHEKLALEDDLGWAWDHDQFVLHYQPIVAAATGRIVGAEALTREAMVGVEAFARWPHLERGMMTPAYFIPLAERTGRIVALDRWAIATAVKQAAAWKAQSWEGWVSVNLSARSLHDSELPAYIARVLETNALEPERLVVEITESAAMHDTAATAAVLHELKQTGVIIAVDDFGIGHSSLAYLKHFPVDLLKLDGSFIEEIGVNEKDEQMLEIMISLAHRIGAQVIAEGVEHQAQMDWLTAAGCDYIQGYLVGRPTPADAITQARP
jgi:diguanylate cyclase (GGDEF)-like protein/PAS domain S-box-containing protein